MSAPKKSMRPKSRKALIENNPIFQHHKKNVEKGTYVKNEDGSISTVYTTIMGDGEHEYLIPQVWDGKILSEDEAFERAMSSGIKWPKAPAGEDGVRELEDLDKKLHEKMQGFAEGGRVKSMEEQMNLFEYGGLADDGMDIEPVTGNEVPPGSLAKEVRDDVPAMLSEGEYVVPADVVRYFGVKFFEDLRNKAKSDMVDLEAEGRIGGEPVDSNGIPMEEDEDLTPEEMAMLEEALGADSGMAMGGLAINQQPPQDPYQQQQTMYAQQYANGGMVKGYQVGGSITQPTFRYMSGQRYPMGSAYGAGSYSATGGFEARTYVNETTGQTRTFQFLNGQPISFIPPGFVPYSQAETTAASAETPSTTTTTTTPKVREEGDGKDAPDMSYDVTSMTDAELGRMADPNSMENQIAKGIFGLVGGPLGAAAAAAMAKARSKEAKMEQTIRSQAREAIKSDVEDIIQDLKDEAKDLAQDAPTDQDFLGTPTPPSDTTTAPVGLTGTAEAPAGTPAEPVMGYTSGNVAPTPTAPSEVGYTGFPTQALGIPSPGTPVGIPSLDEGIFGIDTPQTGGLFGGTDISNAVAQSVANAAAAARGAFTGMDEAIVGVDTPSDTTAIGPMGYANPPSGSANLTGIMGFGTDQSAPNATPGVDVSPSTGISGAMSAALGGFGTSKGGEFDGTPTAGDSRGGYGGLAGSVGAEAPSTGPSGNFGGGSGSISGAQSAASMGFGSDRGGEFGGGPDGGGGTSGGGSAGTGGGGADSGQAGGGGAGGSGGGSSGGDAGTGSDNDGDGFGDMGGIAGGWSKGGMVTKKKKGLGGRP